MKNIRRNDPCHCGSGKKYKNCHQPNEGQKKASKSYMTVGIIAIVMIILAIVLIFNEQSSGNNAPGEAPEGKVWSEEHGHWHDK